jgi:protein-disulfide isomerase
MEKTNISTGTGIIVAGFLIALAIFITKAPATPKVDTVPDTATTTTGTNSKADITKVVTANMPFIGDANAPVTIAYWSDYQCPFCKKFETTTFQSILKNYVDTGKVKVVFKDYAFLGSDSITAGVYARAVWELYPAQYMAWREEMYNKQDDEGDQGFGDEASVLAMTETIKGIDATKVAQAVAANKDRYEAMMDADKSEGSSMGITGTPGFILGNQEIAGAVPYSQFQTAIDALLK